MNLAVKEGWLLSSSLHQVQSFAHSSIQTGKWLTCHFSFTNSCWGIIGKRENEQQSTISKVLRLGKKKKKKITQPKNQINQVETGETAKQCKIEGELENYLFIKKRRKKVVEKVEKNKCKENKMRSTKMSYHCFLKLSNWEEMPLVTNMHRSRVTS